MLAALSASSGMRSRVMTSLAQFGQDGGLVAAAAPTSRTLSDLRSSSSLTMIATIVGCEMVWSAAMGRGDVLIGEVGGRGGDESFPGNAAHGVEHAAVGYFGCQFLE